MEETKKYTPTDTTKLLDKFNKILYVFGFRGFWMGDVKFPKTVMKIIDILYPVLIITQGTFGTLQLGAYFTQKHLNSVQKIDALVMGFGQPMMLLYCLNCRYYKKACREVFYHLFVVLKTVYNDKETEENMVKRLKLYFGAYLIFSLLIVLLYGSYASVETVRKGATFVTVVTAWPDVTDTSKLASYARVGIFMYWSVYSFTTSVVIIIVLIIFLGLTYQYINLQRYFENLNSIFENDRLSHEEMEKNFEKALQNGIKAHSETLWCVKQCRMICSAINAGVILLTTGTLVILMPAILGSKDDLLEAMMYLMVFNIVLMIMAFFMCNAGDTTVEAQKLPNAIYSCGWYNCYGKRSARIRSLVVVAMIQAQEPVVFTGFGVIELSYENFVTIIKSAYSLISVFH
ncbi:uncharacterized protein LOC115446606 [Manduca sexta]|uniref:Odorant receptor n=2 Tax=Manduca sexta TaxID=7130 RepID=A0A922CPS9_MANSE|nr:uncharacterized protein LOC115446606 [Manduca sexta]KAG6454910.1 hypothetical protein O3G_MSEX008947 [Manduca sexta]